MITIEEIEPYLPYFSYDDQYLIYCRDKLYSYFKEDCTLCPFLKDGYTCTLSRDGEEVYALLKLHYPELLI